MSAYNQWNEALAARFFNTALAGRNVHLYVNQVLIDDMEQEMREAGTFLAAVAGQPSTYYEDREHICQSAYREFSSWRNTRLNFPPYIGYLCLFVLASDTDGDFAPHAYYPRLRNLLMTERKSGSLPWFDRMRELWDDLEIWSLIDRQGELGIFQSRYIGGNVHIGYPLSQTILAEQDRRVLPHVFYMAGLDPTSIHQDDEIAMALRSQTARKLLRARTVQMAESSDDDRYNALIDAVSDELMAWDGTIKEPGPSRSQITQTFAGLRICIEVNRAAGIVKSSIRCKLNREFPEKGLTLDCGLRAEEDVNGWSLPVKSADTGKTLDASLLNWFNGETMRATSPSYQMKLKGYPVRIFTSGLPEGISGLVEAPALPLQGQSFYLCYPEASWPRLHRWATMQCRKFQELRISQGLPRSWRLASVEAAVDDEAVKDEFPILSFRPGIRLRLLGGIRSSNGNNFFAFAPPSVALIGGTPDTKLYCNEMMLEPTLDSGVFDLPDDLPNRSRITLEARSGQKVLRRQSLFLTSDFSIPQGEPELFLDTTGTGTQPDGDKTSISGAYIKCQSHELVTFAAEVFEDLKYEMGRIRGFLIGQNPGQIVAWPSQPFPCDWIPAWVISKQGPKNWEAVFVGKMLGTTLSRMPDIPSRRNLKDWKEVIWHRRKRILPPGRPDERALWNQIQEVSRNV